jgi:preprotein translocase subunit SecD
MSPIIREPILGGEVQISGSMTMADARSLAGRLSSGGAQVEVEIVSE